MRSGAECTDRVAQVTQYVERLVAEGKEDEVFAHFDYPAIPIGEFYYYFADITAGAVQGGTRKQFCDTLIKVEKDDEALLEFFAKAALGDGFSLTDYDHNVLANTTIDFNANGRQWVYQTCTHLGYFQTPGETGHPLRGDISIDFWDQYCEDIYGAPLSPDDSMWNMRYGGKNLATSQTIFTNGVEDPWKHASITTSREGITAIEIDCENCAHCVDLRGNTPSDSDALKEARSTIATIMEQWIEAELAAEGLDLSPMQREGYLEAKLAQF